MSDSDSDLEALAEDIAEMDRIKKWFPGGKSSPEKETPVEEYCKRGQKEDIVVLNAMTVTDFSSQYGSETSISYTANNLAGRGNIYPSYGDFTQACVFRTYGPWWDIVPSSRQPFHRTPPSFRSQDYIELHFSRKVYPLQLEIYETYNPGCVVRILACEKEDDTNVDTGCQMTRWKTLWEGRPINAGQSSRMFSPPLKHCPFATDLIRLELCHTLAHYYTELDYVVLSGTKTPNSVNKRPLSGLPDNWTTPVDGKPLMSELSSNMKVLTLNTKSGFAEDHDLIATPDDDMDDIEGKPVKVDKRAQLESKEGNSPVKKEEIVERLSSEEYCAEPEEAIESDNGYFDLLPEEVIQLILSFFDVLSLCRVARTCRLFHQHSYDSLQYTELNLQPHWTQVNDVALDSMHSRSLFLQRLNLSWCHGNIVSHGAFCRFMEASGKNLKCLYLSSCSFMETESIEVITKYCPNLTELDLDSCREVECIGLIHIRTLTQLERLNLYRTSVDFPTIITIIRSCVELRHLNLGSCNCITSHDEVMINLSRHCRHLISLDLWRCKYVTHVGVTALATGCPDLQELDIGWCSEVKSSSDCITYLAEGCRNLKKLYLTANRTVCDRDLLALTEYSMDLEQLDILGTRQVSAEVAHKILLTCKKLVFFDVSFCSGINNYDVESWSGIFPNCSIKKSFQN